MSTTELKGTVILATDTSAKVGIGKSVPTTALDVSGQVFITGATTLNASTRIGNNLTYPSSDILYIADNKNTTVRIGRNKYTNGTGTTYGTETTRNTIAFTGYIDGSADRGSIQEHISSKICAINKQTYGSTTSTQYTNSVESGDLAFFTQNPQQYGDTFGIDTTTEKMRITDLGRVGIGTTTPLYTLDVSGSSNFIGSSTTVTGTDNSVFSMSIVGNSISNGLAIYPKYIITDPQVSQKSNIALYGSFETYPTDHSSKRCADIYAGFSGGTWGSEFLGFGVSSGVINYDNIKSIERMRISGGPNTVVRIGQRGYAGVAADTSTTGLERSRHTIAFAGYRHDDTNQIGATITCLNKQSWVSETEKQLIQSSDLVFSVNDNTFVVNEKMRITYKGNVGIGTSTPTCPLEVATNTAINIGANGVYFNFANSNTGTAVTVTNYANQSPSIAIRASGTNGRVLVSAGYFVESDRRIKTDIIDINDDSALVMFRQLKPKTYRYKDVISRGSETVYGFIAQEVKEIIPYSNVIRKETTPNIYETATFIADTITLVYNTVDLVRDASGALFTIIKVKTREDKDEFVNIVEVIDEHTIRVDKDLTEWGGQVDASGQVVPGDKIFVYGQEVDDFHTLNKDAIWTVATAALQEVDRQLQAEKQKTADLQSTVLDLQSTLALVLARLDALENKP